MATVFKSVTGGYVIKSANIKVYPCANRVSGTDTNAQLGTEYNVTNIRSGKTYVINKPSSGTVKLSVGGYYFELLSLDASDVSTYLATSKYCNIKVTDGVLKDTVGSNNTLDYNGGSGDNYFYGLLFTTTAKTGTGWISLKFDKTKEVDLTYSDVGAAAASHTHSKSDVGLGSVGNFKAVSTEANQGLSAAEKNNARTNIGAGTSNLTIGSTSTTAAAGDHTHSYAGSEYAGGAATSANKVNSALTFSNVSNANKTFDGSSPLTVKPGTNITFSTEGNDITINATGKLSVNWTDGVSDKPTINSVTLKAESAGGNTLDELGIQGVLSETNEGTYGSTTSVAKITLAKAKDNNTKITKIEDVKISFPDITTKQDKLTTTRYYKSGSTYTLETITNLTDLTIRHADATANHYTTNVLEFTGTDANNVSKTITFSGDTVGASVADGNNYYIVGCNSQGITAAKSNVVKTIYASKNTGKKYDLIVEEGAVSAATVVAGTSVDAPKFLLGGTEIKLYTHHVVLKRTSKTDRISFCFKSTSDSTSLDMTNLLSIMPANSNLAAAGGYTDTSNIFCTIVAIKYNATTNKFTLDYCSSSSGGGIMTLNTSTFEVYYHTVEL